MKIPIQIEYKNIAQGIFRPCRNSIVQSTLFSTFFVLFLVFLRNTINSKDLFLQLFIDLILSIFLWIAMCTVLGQLSIRKCAEVFQTSLLIFLLLSSLILQTDRSRTNFTLAWIEKNHVTFIDDKFIVSINNPEALNTSAIQQRLAEHERRMFLKVDGQRVKLSLIGYGALSFSEMLAKLFRLEGWQEGTRDFTVKP